MAQRAGQSEGRRADRPPTCAQAARYSNSAVTQSRNATNDGAFGADATSHATNKGLSMSDNSHVVVEELRDTKS